MRRVLKELVVDRIAAVDRPCQAGAVVTIMKRQKPLAFEVDSVKKVDIKILGDYLAKSLFMFPVSPAEEDDDDAYCDFNDKFDEMMECKEKSDLTSELWPLYDALRESINSIIMDSGLAGDDRLLAIRDTVGQFLTAVQQKMPDALAQLDKIMTKGVLRMDLRKRLLMARLQIAKHKIAKQVKAEGAGKVKVRKPKKASPTGAGTEATGY